MHTFDLPSEIAQLFEARNRVREYYLRKLAAAGSEVDLRFTLDGNLIGDIGEALGAELFGIKLVEAKSTEGIDGLARDGRSVQIKATGTGRGPAFRNTVVHADHLIFFDLDLHSATGKVLFNGPEKLVRATLPETFVGQRMVSNARVRALDQNVRQEDRLPIVP